MTEYAVHWYGHDSPDDLADWLLKSNGRLLDAARDGRWADALSQIDAGDPQEAATRVNCWRLGGKSWFTPLHQAAWHGAPVPVVEELLGRGAWKTLRAADGRRPVDIASERGHDHLVELLEPTFSKVSPLNGRADAMNSQLAALVERVAGAYLDPLPVLRPVDVTQLHEDAGPDRIWFPVGGMYGGFSLSLHLGYVHCRSWSRVVGRSGQYHVVTDRDPVLVDSGFL